MKHHLLLLFFCISLTIGSAFASVPNYWEKSAYAIECEGKTIREILQQFAEDFGVIIDMTSLVGGSCSGWIRSPSAVGFLDSVAIDYKLTWYLFNDTLYISSISENELREVDVGEGVYEALTDLGLVKKKFGWGSIDENDQAIVTGPKSYLTNITQITNSLKAKSEEIEEIEEKEFEEKIFVLPLKYASVTDRETRVRNRSVVTPGVATILNNMLGGGDGGGGGNYQVSKKVDSPSGELLKINTKTDKEVKFTFKVQADPRTNSLIIRSRGKPLEYFKAIVDTLDIPQSSIELDLVVVDISREKMSEIGVNLRAESLFEKDDVTGAVLSNTGVLRGVSGSGLSDTLRSGVTSSSDMARFDDLRSNRVIRDGVGNFSALMNVPDFARFYADVQLLTESGDASVIANTSLLAIENQPASIDLSTTFYIRNSSERVANSQPVTVGTLLNVTPHAIDLEDGKKIKLAIEIEDGSILPQSVEGLPLVRRSQINTRVIVPEGNTLVLGGHRSQTSSSSRRGVPGLSQLPIVKNLFSVKEQETRNTERLYILTPRIAPEMHRVQDYLTLDEANVTQKMLDNIDRRWNASTRELVNNNLGLLKSMLASEPLPEGFHIRKNMSGYLPVECRSAGLVFEQTDDRVVYGKSMAVYRFEVSNKSYETKEVHEHACFGRGLLSAVNAGARTLAPGQYTTLFVSTEVNKVASEIDTFY